MIRKGKSRMSERVRETDHQFGYMASTGRVNCLCGWSAPAIGLSRDRARDKWSTHVEQHNDCTHPRLAEGPTTTARPWVICTHCGNSWEVPALTDDLYLSAARAHVLTDVEIIGVPIDEEQVTAAAARLAADPRIRAAVDAARAPLLARIAALEAADVENRAIFAKYVGELHTALLDIEQLTFERDQARARVAELKAETGRLACCESAAED